MNPQAIENRQVPEASALIGPRTNDLQLPEDFPAVRYKDIPVMIEALGSRKSWVVWMDPLLRCLDKPGDLKRYRLDDEQKERIEAELAEVGPQGLPYLSQAFDHPNPRVRYAIARLMARQGAAAVPLLLPALQNPRTRLPAADALTEIGKPAVQPLVALLHNRLSRDAAWIAADLALSRIERMTSYYEVKNARDGLVRIWIVALAAAALAFGVGLWAEIGFTYTGLAAVGLGYVTWAASLTYGDSGHQDSKADSDGLLAVIGLLIFLVELLAAPFEYRRRAAEYASLTRRREKMKRKYSLPQ